jgi:hypothetical protein
MRERNECAGRKVYISMEIIDRPSILEIWMEGKTLASEAFSKYIPGEMNQKTTVDYVLRNPERAGLVDDWKKWKYWAQPNYDAFGWVCK